MAGLLRAGDAGYDDARLPWNTLIDQRPAGVARPRNVGEVVAAVRAAAQEGLRVAPQRTGHAAGAMPSLDGVILLRTDGLAEVSIDASRMLARVGAGASWLDVVQAAGRSRLAALHGSAPDVGVVGYSLGGGISWYGRLLGLQANHVTAAEMVLADGSTVRATADDNPELFWAVRGGGGSFGVVTAIEFRLFPIETVYAGFLLWDWSQTERVLRRYVDWAAQAPDEATTALRIMQIPPVPDIPEAIRGRQLVVVDGALLTDDGTASQILAPLRELAPEIDTFDRVLAPTLSWLHMDPERPSPSVSDSMPLTGLPPVAIDALLSVAGPDSRTSLLLPAELRHLGGALGRPDPHGGAVSHLDGAYLLSTIGVPVTARDVPAITAEIARITAAMRPHRSGRPYLGFVERPTDPSTGYDEATWARLRRVRADVDPGGLFVAVHAVPA